MNYDSEREYIIMQQQRILSRYYIRIPQKQDFWKHYTLLYNDKSTYRRQGEKL
jgi:hypothetical protein